MYCQKHGVMRASMLQVLRDVCDENEDVPCNLPSRGAVLVDASEVACLLLQKPNVESPKMEPAASTSGIGSAVIKGAVAVVTLPFSLTKQVITGLWAEDDDDDGEEWRQDGDDAFENDDDTEDAADQMSTENKAGFGTSTLIVNVPLTRSAVRLLEHEINSHHAQSFQGDMPIVLGQSEWVQWSATVLSKGSCPALSNLSMHDKEFLLEVLTCMRIAKIIRRREKFKAPDLIVLFPASMIAKVDKEQAKQNDVSEIPESLNLPVSLWDIRNAEQLIERQIEALSEQVNECGKKALEYKKRNKKNLALVQMKKRKTLEQNIEAAHEKLLSLGQQKAAIENAQSNKVVLDVMKGSTQLLRKFREETSLEDADDVQDDLLSEMDSTREFHETIAATNNIAMGGPVDDDELLKELEGLTFEELEMDEEKLFDIPQCPPASSSHDEEMQSASADATADESVQKDRMARRQKQHPKLIIRGDFV
jgi:hypothetical protein